VSSRPILKKRANRLRKVMRRTPDGFIDLIAYLKDRGYAQTTGEAEKIILAGRVRSESHTLGIGKASQLRKGAALKAAVGQELTPDDFEEVDVVSRHVRSGFRPTIQVTPA